MIAPLENEVARKAVWPRSPDDIRNKQVKRYFKAAPTLPLRLHRLGAELKGPCPRGARRTRAAGR